MFAVSAQSQRDQNQEGSGPAAEPHQVLPCAVQVSILHRLKHVM